MNKSSQKNLPWKADWLHRLKGWWISPYSFQFVFQVIETRITFQLCGCGQLMSLTLKKRLVPCSCRTEHNFFLSLCCKFYSISFEMRLNNQLRDSELSSELCVICGVILPIVCKRQILAIKSPKVRKKPFLGILYFFWSLPYASCTFSSVTSNNPLILFPFMF